jgi:hypothetical protein
MIITLEDVSTLFPGVLYDFRDRVKLLLVHQRTLGNVVLFAVADHDSEIKQQTNVLGAVYTCPNLRTNCHTIPCTIC